MDQPLTSKWVNSGVLWKRDPRSVHCHQVLPTNRENFFPSSCPLYMLSSPSSDRGQLRRDCLPERFKSYVPREVSEPREPEERIKPPPVRRKGPVEELVRANAAHHSNMLLRRNFAHGLPRPRNRNPWNECLVHVERERRRCAIFSSRLVIWNYVICDPTAIVNFISWYFLFLLMKPYERTLIVTSKTRGLILVM